MNKKLFFLTFLSVPFQNRMILFICNVAKIMRFGISYKVFFCVWCAKCAKYLTFDTFCTYGVDALNLVLHSKF